ncbi:MAG: hypothetical protein R3D26_24625 [Cyanobacteriota/Melainabacteria group bacterium]
MHANKDAETLSSVTGRDVPIAVENLVARCMAKRPEARFQKMEELKYALENLAATVESEFSEVHGASSPPSSSSAVEGRRLSTSRIVSLFLFLVTDRHTRSLFQSLLSRQRNGEAFESG